MNFDFSQTIIRKIYLKRNGELCGKIFPVRAANLRFSGDRSDEET